MGYRYKRKSNISVEGTKAMKLFLITAGIVFTLGGGLLFDVTELYFTGCLSVGLGLSITVIGAFHGYLIR